MKIYKVLRVLIFIFSVQPVFSAVDTIVVDINILLKENVSAFIKKIGFGNIASYAIRHWKNPVDGCLDILDGMSKETEHTPSERLTYKGRLMPKCIVDWYLGNKQSDEVKQELLLYIEEKYQNGKIKHKDEKEMACKIIELILTPEMIRVLAQPITPMIDTIKLLKSKGYQVYGIINIAQEILDILKQTFPELVGIFSGIVTSAESKQLKPNKDIYQTFLSTYQIKPEQCIYIDAQKDHIQTGKEVGLSVIEYKNPKTTKTQLKKIGIL